MYLHKECGSHQSSRLWGEALHLKEYIFLDSRQFSGPAAVYPRSAPFSPHVKMTFGLIDVRYSLPFGQKLTFFAPLLFDHFDTLLLAQLFPVNLSVVSGHPNSHAQINFQNGRRSINIQNLSWSLLVCNFRQRAIHLDITQSGGELDLVGSNSKSVGRTRHKVQFDSPIIQAVSRAAKSIIGNRVHNNKELVSPDMT